MRTAAWDRGVGRHFEAKVLVEPDVLGCGCLQVRGDSRARREREARLERSAGQSSASIVWVGGDDAEVEVALGRAVAGGVCFCVLGVPVPTSLERS